MIRSNPRRAVVAPPHLPAKTNGFYALMRQALEAVWRGPRRDRHLDSSMHFYAPYLCGLGITLCKQGGRCGEWRGGLVPPGVAASTYYARSQCAWNVSPLPKEAIL
jgi:hypothetical protein